MKKRTLFFFALGFLVGFLYGEDAGEFGRFPSEQWWIRHNFIRSRASGCPYDD